MDQPRSAVATHSAIQQARRLTSDATVRAVTVIGLTGIALIHLLDLDSKWHETPYLGVLYLVLIAGCITASGLLLTRHHSLAWTLTTLCALAPLVGYCLSRTTGLPSANADKGNWLEPLGLASLYIEGIIVLLGAAATATQTQAS
jgi:hypothetical protein